MITSKSLKTQRSEFGISQSELANILGISRPTLAKIEKGEKQLSASEKEKLTNFFSTLSLDQSKQNDNVRINIPQKNIEKFKQVLLYILQKSGAKPNVGLTVIYKLLYFIDFDYYEKFEKQLIGLTYFKNTHGPTPREFKKVIDEMKENEEIIEVKSKFFTHDQKKFLPHIEADLSLISGQELEMIDDVLARYSDKTATQLSEMTHRDTPWKATENGNDIDYELAFYRPDEFSVRDYDTL